MKKSVALFTLLAVLTACGGGGDRPSSDDLAKALKDNGNASSGLASGASDKAIDCIAKTLHDSDLSDKALKAIVDGDADFDASSDDTKAIGDITDDIGKCITG